MILKRLWNKLMSDWRIRTDPIGYARSMGVRMGKDCRLLALTSGTFGSEPYLVQLGDHVTVTAGVHFVTHDGGVWVFRKKEPDIDVFAPVVVGDNVFIGICAIIMPGVKIGNDCIIGAGSIVTHDIPPGSIAVGVPARVIGNVDEYRKKIEDRVVHIRGLSDREKRSILTERFWGKSPE